MTVMDIFWIFFILAALQPVLQQRMLEAMRMRKIAPAKLPGYPARAPPGDDAPPRLSLGALHRRQRFRAGAARDPVDRPRRPLGPDPATPRGLVLAASQITRASRDHKSKVIVFVPHYAMSGGTLIALSADQIVMSSHAVLGPVDPQLKAAASLIKVIEQKPIAEIDDDTLLIGLKDPKASGLPARLTASDHTDATTKCKIGGAHAGPAGVV